MSRLPKTTPGPSLAQSRWHRVAAWLLLVGLLLLGTGAAFAGEPARSAPKNTALVRFGGKVIYEVKVGQGRISPAVRAQSAEKTLKEAVASEEELPVRVEQAGDEEVIYLGTHPWLRVGEPDRLEAGDPSLRVHADTIAGRLRDVVENERRRMSLAKNVFAVSLVVFSTLIAIYLLGKSSELSSTFRSWFIARKKKLPSLSVQNFEVVGPGAVRGAFEVAIEASKWIARGFILYLWFFITFSQFSATKGYVDALTGSFLSPVAQLFARLTTTLPLAVIGLVGVLALALLLRFVGIFFEGVYAGDTSLTWLDRDLARPTGVLFRIAILLCSLLFVAPLVSGNATGVFPSTALIFLFVTGLAATPLLASALLGLIIIYRRSIRPGEWLSYGNKSGRVSEVTLFGVLLRDTEHRVVHVPHLLAFVHPTIHHGAVRSHRLVIPVRSNAPVVLEVLRNAACSLSSKGSASLLRIETDAVYYEVVIHSDQESAAEDLHRATYEALLIAAIEWAGPSGDRTS